MLSKEERELRWADGQSYNSYISSELHSFRKQAWKDILNRHLTAERPLDILDAGTGPGFFACILSEEGHRVTGIDSSDGMLACAGENAVQMGLSPTFRKMDVDSLDFQDHSFDAIVVRNVIWTLQAPEIVYQAFQRILRPGGQLLIYDANWHMHYFDADRMRRVREREQRYFEKYGRREVVCYDDMEYFRVLPLSNTVRPQWDKAVLQKLGFAVSVQEDIGSYVYEEWEKDLYGESPLFEVYAVKNT